MREGVRIAVDVGTVRVGVAASDGHGVLASPVTTLARDPRGRDIAELAAIVTEREAIEVVVGLPLTLAGRAGAAVEAAREYAALIAAVVAPLPVRLVDERLSTVGAERHLRASGRRGNARDRRRVVDQVAAVVFLQTALDGERQTGQPRGELVSAVDGDRVNHPGDRRPD